MIVDHNAISFFAQIVTGSPERVEQLAGDASTRRYWRVTGMYGTAVVCHDPTLHDEEHPFLATQRILEGYGLPVPRIYEVDHEARMILLQDLGPVSLEEFALTATADQIRSRYLEALDLAVRINQVQAGLIKERQPFNSEKLLWEYSYFMEHFFLGFCGARPTSHEQDVLNELFEWTSRSMDQPGFFATCHRDFHSRNLFLFNGTLHVIDFQDAMKGLPQYDAVSLIRDAYTVLSPQLVDELTVYHRQLCMKRGVFDGDQKAYDELFSIASFQRTVKALGSFGSISSRPGMEYFSRWIQPGIDNLALYARQDDRFEEGVFIIMDAWAGRKG